MKIYIRDTWNNYEEITLTDFNNRIDHLILTDYILDKLTEDTIYLTEIERKDNDEIY